MDERRRERPWTVYALVVWVIVGAAWALITSDGNVPVQILWFALSMLFAVMLWKGVRSVFTLSFMLTSLCAGIILLVLFVQSVLFGDGLQTKLLLPLASSLAFMALLLHPGTKRFAGVEQRASEQPV